jgi:hypothetical protein
VADGEGVLLGAVVFVAEAWGRIVEVAILVETAESVGVTACGASGVMVADGASRAQAFTRTSSKNRMRFTVRA